MWSSWPSKLTVAAGLSLTASMALALASFALPSAHVFPFILTNWLLFMLVGYLALPMPSLSKPFPRPAKDEARIFAVVLIAFSLAGLFALGNSSAG